MQPRSAIFDRFCALSHETIVEADALYNGEVVHAGLAVVDGSVTHDATAMVQGRATIQLAEPLLIPSTTDVLSPYGFEIALRRGIEIPGSEPEMMPLGVFGIQDSGRDGATLVTSLSCFDRAHTVNEARLEDVVQIAAGTNYGTAIQSLIAQGMPGIEFRFTATSEVTPLITLPAQAERWVEASKMARAIGMVIDFDGLGRCRMRPNATLDDQPVLALSEGDDGILTAASLTRSRTPAYNKVIAASANAGSAEQYRAEAWDNDPASPTYYFGGFRRKPRFFASPLIGSQSQAELSARTLLSSALGIARSINFQAVPNYALEVRDVVRVHRPALGIVHERHIIDRLTISLNPEGPMTGSTRSKQETTP